MAFLLAERTSPHPAGLRRVADGCRRNRKKTQRTGSASEDLIIGLPTRIPGPLESDRIRHRYRVHGSFGSVGAGSARQRMPARNLITVSDTTLVEKQEAVMNRNRRNQGFTLIELMIVVAVIATIAGIAL